MKNRLLHRFVLFLVIPISYLDASEEKPSEYCVRYKQESCQKIEPVCKQIVALNEPIWDLTKIKFSPDGLLFQVMKKYKTIEEFPKETAIFDLQANIHRILPASGFGFVWAANSKDYVYTKDNKYGYSICCGSLESTQEPYWELPFTRHIFNLETQLSPQAKWISHIVSYDDNQREITIYSKATKKIVFSKDIKPRSLDLVSGFTKDDTRLVLFEACDDPFATRIIIHDLEKDQMVADLEAPIRGYMQPAHDMRCIAATSLNLIKKYRTDQLKIYNLSNKTTSSIPLHETDGDHVRITWDNHQSRLVLFNSLKDDHSCYRLRFIAHNDKEWYVFGRSSLKIKGPLKIDSWSTENRYFAMATMSELLIFDGTTAELLLSCQGNYTIQQWKDDTTLITVFEDSYGNHIVKIIAFQPNE